MVQNRLVFDSLLGYSANPEMAKRGFYFVEWNQADVVEAIEREAFHTEVLGLLFCDEGEIELSIDGQPIRCGKQSLLILRPNVQLSIINSRSLTMRGVLFNPQLKVDYTIPLRYLTSLYMSALRSPVVELSQEEWKRLNEVLGGFKNVSSHSGETDLYRHVIHSGVAMLLYLLCDLLQGREEDSRFCGQNRAIEYFSHFLQLLAEHSTRERTVKFYADKLCITPKYLTTLVTQISGQSVSKWIRGAVLQEAVHRLLYSNDSVQQIAYDLNFPNQSFFGKFFKAYMGCAPREYRLKRG